MDPLQTSIEYLKGVGPNRADLLKKELKIFTFQDLLYFFPNRYIDRSRFYKISELPKNNSEVQLKGEITNIEIISQKSGKRLVAIFSDGENTMELLWFRGYKWINQSLKKNVPYILFGRVNWFKGKPSIPHPEMDLESDFIKKPSQILKPIYPSTEALLSRGISQKVIFNLLINLFQGLKTNLAESLPEYLIKKYNFISKHQAIRNIHFPTNQKSLSMAQERLKFEEFFFIQLQLIIKNNRRKKKIKGFKFKKVGDGFNSFFKNNLSFELTNAQKKVIKEIRKDLGSGGQMNRLLQGDVGSGKTIVALMSMLIAYDNGYQSCLMAPTEILAQQHFQSLKNFLINLNISVDILTGNSKKSHRNSINEDLKKGKLNILIGTHSIIEEKVTFLNLGLAIIDEQHRFGVAQRAKLWKKNLTPPHILVMTATPIPRTLSMTLYGDLDVSVIDELPPGRKEIKTYHQFDSNRLKVYKFIKEEIKSGAQIYIVYPLIQESEKMDYKDLMDGYESITRYFPQPEFQISVVHGKMKSPDKEYEMNRFLKGETNIMVATTVIEVGVNITNASVMIIESSERFGLSQLHQLRGRVGRGNKQSYCVLMSNNKLNEDAKKRLKTMTETNDGFKIAETDLSIRGPGNIMGTEQSGILKLKIADIVNDNLKLKIARNEAIEIVKKDPNLMLNENKIIRKTLFAMKAYKNMWNYIS